MGAVVTFDHHWCRLHGQTNENVCDEDYILDNHWGFYETYEVSNNTYFHYLRLVLYVPIGTTINNWFFVESDIPGKWKYVYEYNNDDHRDLFLNLNGRIDHSTTQLFFVDAMKYMKNGFSLEEVLNELLKENCPDLKIVSDFFQWRPENQSDINYVTGITSMVNKLRIFQKSDVKRPNASNPATKAETTFFELFSDVLRMFNCGYLSAEIY